MKSVIEPSGGATTVVDHAMTWSAEKSAFSCGSAKARWFAVCPGVYRGAVIVLPVLVYVVTKRICLELQASDRIEAGRKLAEEEARRAAPERGIA